MSVPPCCEMRRVQKPGIGATQVVRAGLEQNQGQDEERNGSQVLKCLLGACICDVIFRTPTRGHATLCRRQWQQPPFSSMTGCYVCGWAALSNAM